MSAFIFMLTHHDATIPNALAVYDEVRDSALQHVGVKDVGASRGTLAELVRRMRSDGRTVYLEVVSPSARDELESIVAARELGVDVVMGGTHVDASLEALEGSGLRFFPFPGRVVGHPSVLEGTTEEIAGSAADLSARPGVSGLDLLAYRHRGPVEDIIAAVVRASTEPVVVAGNVDLEQRIKALTELGAWGFTIGGAILEGRFPAGPSVREQVDWVLAAAGAAQRQARG